MSGTSLDSVDYALCSVRADRIRLRDYWQRKFPASLQHQLQLAAQGLSSSHDTARLDHDLGRCYAEQAAAGLGRIKPDLIGLHGQTIFHGPGKNPATLQLGEAAYLAERLRVPVVSNFRAADLAAGGQGAPLATLFHRVVFSHSGIHVCVNNLGGISNVTSIDWRSSREPQVMAFDTGPANMLLDLAVRHYSQGRRRFDTNGAWARRGTVAMKLLSDWLEHPYFTRKPPKSTGREQFGEVFLEPALWQMRKARLSQYDALATLTAFTAHSLALNYRLHLNSIPDRTILAGGGAANHELVKRIREALLPLNPRLELQTCEEAGWPAQSIEPAAFALLAYYRFHRWPGNLPETTGARRPCLLGQISEPGA